MNIKINVAKKRKIVITELKQMSSQYMNDQAVDAGYDSLLDMMVEDEDDTQSNKAEAKKGRVYRKTVRSAIKQIQKDVMDGTRTMPIEEELKAELPALK